jgi:hypothetical protein
MEKQDRDRQVSVSCLEVFLTECKLTQTKPGSFLKVYDLPHIIWLFTESNLPTFVAPNTAFGIFGALAGRDLTNQNSPGFRNLLIRLPVVILFNVCKLTEYFICLFA